MTSLLMAQKLLGLSVWSCMCLTLVLHLVYQITPVACILTDTPQRTVHSPIVIAQCTYLGCVLVLLQQLYMAAGKQQQGSAKKGKSAKAEKGDKLDDMVASYKAKYFGTQVHQKQSGAKPAQKRPISGIGRWFE